MKRALGSAAAAFTFLATTSASATSAGAQSGVEPSSAPPSRAAETKPLPWQRMTIARQAPDIAYCYQEHGYDGYIADATPALSFLQSDIYIDCTPDIEDFHGMTQIYKNGNKIDTLSVVAEDLAGNRAQAESGLWKCSTACHGNYMIKGYVNYYPKDGQLIDPGVNLPGAMVNCEPLNDGRWHKQCTVVSAFII